MKGKVEAGEKISWLLKQRKTRFNGANRIDKPRGSGFLGGECDQRLPNVFVSVPFCPFPSLCSPLPLFPSDRVRLLSIFPSALNFDREGGGFAVFVNPTERIVDKIENEDEANAITRGELVSRTRLN